MVVSLIEIDYLEPFFHKDMSPLLSTIIVFQPPPPPRRGGVKTSHNYESVRAFASSFLEYSYLSEKATIASANFEIEKFFSIGIYIRVLSADLNADIGASGNDFIVYSFRVNTKISVRIEKCNYYQTHILKKSLGTLIEILKN